MALRDVPGLLLDTLGTVELAHLGGICAEPVDPPLAKNAGANPIAAAS